MNNSKNEILMINKEENERENTKKEVKEVILLALPACATNILLQLMGVVDMLMVGRLGKDELAAAALSNTYFMMYFLFIIGVQFALDTFGAQSFGMGDVGGIEMWALRGAFVLSLVCVPVIVLMMFAEEVMVALGQEKEISRMTGDFCRILSVGMWFISMFGLCQKYLQCQNIMMPSVYVAFICNLVNAGANYLLIYYLDWGLDGAPIATSFSRIVQFFMIFGYILYHRRHHLKNEREIDWNKVLQRDKLMQFWKLGFFGGVMLCLEGWTFEGTTLIAGTLGTKQLDGHAIMLTICAFTFVSFPLGISMAANIRVGNLVGSRDNMQAKKAGTIALIIGVIFMTCTGITIFCARHVLGEMFVSDEGVINMVSKIAPVAALFQFVDGFQGVAGGIQRGLGRQKLVAFMNLCGFWVIGLPLGVLMCFYFDVGILGIWWGLFIGLACVTIFHFTSLFMFTDWKSVEIVDGDAEYRDIDDNTSENNDYTKELLPH